MKSKFFVLLTLLTATVVALANCQKTPSSAPQPTAAEAKEQQVERGRYLVNSMGCDDCHTPKKMTPQGPEPDLERRFMGHPAAEPFAFDDKKALIAEQHVAIFSPGMTAIAGPWGVSYAANLTPDESGIGNWTDAQFLKAIREGKSKGLDGTRPLLPPMPWQVYANLKDEDLKAIFAYLQMAKPIANVVPNPQVF